MSKISKLSLISGAAEMVVSAGASAVIGDLVKAVTPVESKKFHKILVAIGGYAIGGVLSDLSAKYVRSQIDGYSEKARALFHPTEEEPLTADGLIVVIEDEPVADELEKTTKKPVKKTTKKSTDEV